MARIEYGYDKDGNSVSIPDIYIPTLESKHVRLPLRGNKYTEGVVLDDVCIGWTLTLVE